MNLVSINQARQEIIPPEHQGDGRGVQSVNLGIIRVIRSFGEAARLVILREHIGFSGDDNSC